MSEVVSSLALATASKSSLMPCSMRTITGLERGVFFVRGIDIGVGDCRECKAMLYNKQEKIV